VILSARQVGLAKPGALYGRLWSSELQQYTLHTRLQRKPRAADPAAVSLGDGAVAGKTDNERVARALQLLSARGDCDDLVLVAVTDISAEDQRALQC
jgi:hypothetical protein